MRVRGVRRLELSPVVLATYNNNHKAYTTETLCSAAGGTSLGRYFESLHFQSHRKSPDEDGQCLSNTGLRTGRRVSSYFRSFAD
jgi:hypothetical protein